jgi:hypothetical protein
LIELRLDLFLPSTDLGPVDFLAFFLLANTLLLGAIRLLFLVAVVNLLDFALSTDRTGFI